MRLCGFGGILPSVMGYKSLSRKDHITNVLLYLAGVIFIPSGIVLAMHAHLGVAGVDSLCYALANRLGVNIAIGVYAITFISLVIAAVLRKSYPRVQCYLTSLIYGFFEGCWEALLPDFTSSAFAVRLLVLFLGILIASIAAACYLLSKLPVNPNDDLLQALREKGLSVMQAKLAFEICYFILALLAGGEIGIGTVAFLIFLGPFMDLWVKRIEKLEPVSALNEHFAKPGTACSRPRRAQ